MALHSRLVLLSSGCGYGSSSCPPRLLPRFYSQSKLYLDKVGIPEFLGGIGKGVEAHVDKLEKEIGDFNKLLVTRTLRLKKLEIPCKHRKLILSYAHKYRLGLWKPRANLATKPST